MYCMHHDKKVVHWSVEIQTEVRPTDRSTKQVNSRSLSKLLFRILQNSRKNKWKAEESNVTRE